MYIYLAHPIDQAEPAMMSPLVRVVGHVLEAARQQGHSLFRPGKAHRLPNPVGPWPVEELETIARINQSALWEADAMIAVLMPKIPTLGTPSEIEMALTFNRPVLILTTASLRSFSVQIANWVSRGANCVLVGEDGHLDGISLAAELSSLPDPSQLVSGELTDGPPELLVRYAPSGSEPTGLVRGKYEGDAGIDLAIALEEPLPVGEYRLLPTGAHVAIPDGYFGLITGRSSTWAKHRCKVNIAIIDSGYRGELMVGIENRGNQAIVFEAGTRLAQLILLPAWGGKIEVTDQLPEHERGENGYGSSGVR